jgi:hypothetical protein
MGDQNPDQASIIAAFKADFDRGHFLLFRLVYLPSKVTAGLIVELATALA